MTARVVFTPVGLSGDVPIGTSVLDAARQLGVDLDSVCGGRAICGRCQVEPAFGSFAKWAIDSTVGDINPPTAAETAYRGKRPLTDGRRLGCMLTVSGDVVIDVPEASQIHRQVIRKELGRGAADFVLDPIYKLEFRELDTAVFRIDGDEPVLSVVLAGFVDTIVGVAVDIGSTTIAAHLIDLGSGEPLASSGRMNPQIRFGEDLMSRVSYVMMNPGGDAELTDTVRVALRDLIGELLTAAGIEAEQVLDVVLVGNPVMHHLVLGIDPTPLGQAPFPLATDGAVHTTAAELALGLVNATVYVAPCIAGHVGADTAAAILAEGPHRSDRVQLLVDVGTNAEIVLGTPRGLLAASSPTGPAFEGAQIVHGQRATAGAIERVLIDAETLEPRIRVIGEQRWSNDPDFNSEAGVTGICGSGIIEVLSEMVRVGILDQQGVIRGELAAMTSRIVPNDRTFSYVLYEDIHITQADVRAIQLAKAALRAGIDLLLEHAELDTVDEIRLAGAFGAHIDPEHAMNLGLIPTIDVEAVHAVGNAAGVGAVRALLSASQRREMEATVDAVTKIETATEPRFQDLFVTALGFANAPAPDPENVRAGKTRRRRRPPPT